VDMFQPSEASCRECRKRYQLALAKGAVITPQERRIQGNKQTAMVIFNCLF
jgi:hypothetical protein